MFKLWEAIVLFVLALIVAIALFAPPPPMP
jgi:hypothetical protein